MKPTKTAFVAVLLLWGLLLFSPARAAGNPVVLSSDNAADMAIATFLADSVGGKLIVVPWDIFNSSALGEVLSEKPEEVLIVGGSTAVPEEYSSTLEKKGIQITRFSGRDRFETANMVLNWSLKRGFKPGAVSTS